MLTGAGVAAGVGEAAAVGVGMVTATGVEAMSTGTDVTGTGVDAISTGVDATGAGVDEVSTGIEAVVTGVDTAATVLGIGEGDALEVTGTAAATGMSIGFAGTATGDEETAGAEVATGMAVTTGTTASWGEFGAVIAGTKAGDVSVELLVDAATDELPSVNSEGEAVARLNWTGFAADAPVASAPAPVPPPHAATRAVTTNDDAQGTLVRKSLECRIGYLEVSTLARRKH